MRKVYVLISLIPALLATVAKGQMFFTGTEYGVMAGGSQYFGDLNDKYGFGFIRPAAGVFLRQHLNPYISVRANAVYTRVGYDDKLSSNPYNRMRNLNFRSNIVEGSVQAEFNFFRFATGEEGHRFTPYLTGGIGVFYYNPYTFYNGSKYYLRNIGTEGQKAGYDDRKYGTTAVCFPIGAGVKYWMRPGVNLGFEIANRLTTADYIDDVSTTYVGSGVFPTDPQYPNPAYVLQDRSVELDPAQPLGRTGKQRGNASTKDQYLTFMITLSFQFKVYRCPSFMKHGFITN